MSKIYKWDEVNGFPMEICDLVYIITHWLIISTTCCLHVGTLVCQEIGKLQTLLICVIFTKWPVPVMLSVISQ